MATRKVTVSLDTTASTWRSAPGMASMSAWLSRAARREAVRTSVGLVGDVLADALADEAELMEAERHLHAAG